MRYADVDTSKPISKIGLGTWQFGSSDWGYGSGYDHGTKALVAKALDLGVTLFDTAEIYGRGRSETLLGQALQGRDAFVASKLLPIFPLASVVYQHAHASAARLGVKHFDLYQVHFPNPVVRDGTIMNGMRALQDEGTIDHVGVSNYSLARWRAAEAALGSAVLTNQVQYNLARTKYEADVIPYASNHRRLVIAYSPLAQGLFSGRYSAANPPSGTARSRNPLFLAENLERLEPLLDTVREVAAAHDATPTQIALAYVIHRPSVVAIPGASSEEQLESNVAAADILLKDDEYAALATQASAFRPVGPLLTARKLLTSR